LLVGERELHLIAVKVNLIRSDDGEDGRIQQSPDPLEGIHNVLLLELQLSLIVYMLPLASAADAEVRTAWFSTQRRRLYHLDNMSLGVLLLYLHDPSLHRVTGHRPLNKNDKTVNSADGFAFKRRIVDGEVNFCAPLKFSLWDHGERIASRLRRNASGFSRIPLPVRN
jgi:hypothetical protein